MDSTKSSYCAGLINQLKKFTSLEFVGNATNAIEKLLWISMAILGTVWIGYTMFTQIKNWNEFPVLQTKETVDLSSITFPAVTFCPKAAPEMGIFEGFGNYLDLNKVVPPEAILIRNEGIKLYWKKRREVVGCNIPSSKPNTFANYYYYCCYSNNSVFTSALWCQVLICTVLL